MIKIPTIKSYGTFIIMPRKKRMTLNKGFTLIELLIAIAIVGIIAAVAYPSYQDSVTKSRRTDAQAALMGFAQAMERFYTTEGTYAGAATSGADTGSPTIFSTTSPLDNSSVYYNLKIESASATAYVIGAEPVNTQDGDGVLILKSTVTKGWDSNDTANGLVTGLGASPDEVESTEWCWTNC